MKGASAGFKVRHTTFGRRADVAPDSPEPVKPVKQETPAAARMRRMREKKREQAVTPLLRSVTPNVTVVTPSVTRNVTPSQAQPVTPDVTLVTQMQALADGLKTALGLVKSLTMRIDAMESWGEGMEARLPRQRVAASPLAGSSTSVPASPRIIRPGDMVRAPDGRMVRMPEVDADGQAIPE